jgi:SAM-dependent methyltransferase
VQVSGFKLHAKKSIYFYILEKAQQDVERVYCMNAYCMLSAAMNLNEHEIKGKRVIEIGAYNVNGSVRPLIESYGPQVYIGVDISPGPCVDVVCPVEELVTKFGPQSFDLVISTEMLEHVKDWRLAIHNIKTICREKGTMFLTTRSYGFVYHGYPYDYWRYELDDMRHIFEDCEILYLDKDPDRGVFVKCRKPDGFSEKDLAAYKLYSIVADRRIQDLNEEHLNAFKFKKFVFQTKTKEFLQRKIERFFSKR